MIHIKQTLFPIIRKLWKMIYIRNHVKYARKIGVEVGIETHFVGSIVTKSIPKGQVWAGVPAHFLSAQ